MNGGYVLERCEDAWVNYLTSSMQYSLSGSVSIHKGMDWLDKDGALVVCYAENMEEDFPFSGIYHVQMSIHLRYPFEDSGSIEKRNLISQDLHKTMFDNQNLINSLTGSTTNLGIYAITFGGNSNGFAGDSWVSTTALDIVAVSTN